MSSDATSSQSRNTTAKPMREKPEDRGVITRPPGKKALIAKCSNIQCFVRASEAPLKACARCKVVMYCSRECQATHWPDHKQWCNNNVEHVMELAQADAQGINKGLPLGLTLVELDQKLEKWVKFHNGLLMAATIHALGLPRNLKHSHQYLLRVEVSYRPDNGGVTGKLFRIDDASLIDMQSARAMGGVWPPSIDQITRLREESEGLRRGTVAAVALECKPLAMQIVPFGSLRDLSSLRIQQQWKEILIIDVEAGKRFTRFEL